MAGLASEVEPNLMAIIAEFNSTLKKHGVSNARVVEFTLSDNESPEMEGLVCNFACWIDRGDLSCGVRCQFE